MPSENWNGLTSIDAFFYYGELDVSEANQHDVAVGAVQPKNSLYYDREDSAGITEYENLPASIFIEIVMKYDIARWIARRNLYVGNGEGGTKDRRIATSQSAIVVESDGGDVNVNISFLNLIDLQNPARLSIPVGGI